MLVDRGTAITIEQIDDTFFLDSGLAGDVTDPATTWSGLDHLEGREVTIIADGVPLGTKTVLGGQIILDEPVKSIQIGLAFAHIIEPLPPSDSGAAGAGRNLRLIQAIFRLQDTAALRADVGRGPRDIPLRRFSDGLLDSSLAPVSADIRLRALGWRNNPSRPLWRIEQDAPLPFTLLSVSTELKIND
jgi:hypothetical protein